MSSSSGSAAPPENVGRRLPAATLCAASRALEQPFSFALSSTARQASAVLGDELDGEAVAHKSVGWLCLFKPFIKRRDAHAH
jgi:hypothetical protein